jgi:predicted amidohydrolase
MNPHTCRLALGQMLVEPGEPERNLRRARQMIQRAAEQGAHILVLPECLDLGWTFPGARQMAQPIPGPHSDTLAEAARAARLHVVAGLTEWSRHRLYNAAVLISPAGDLLLKHRKINELDIALDLYTTGDSLAVAATTLGTIAIPICADNFPSSLALGHALARMRAQLLLSPSAWAMEADHDNLREPYGALWLESYTTLARLYDITVAGASNVGPITAGPWQGRKCIGCSLAVGPGGQVLAQGPYGEDAEALIVVETQVLPPVAAGTGFAAELRRRGYEGP